MKNPLTKEWKQKLEMKSQHEGLMLRFLNEIKEKMLILQSILHGHPELEKDYEQLLFDYNYLLNYFK